MLLFTSFSDMLLFWLKVIVPVLFIVIPIFIGNRFGSRLKARAGEIDKDPVGTVVAAGLGLFGFMLAFTFQIAASRYEKRKELFLDHVTTIRTAYLRAGLLNDSTRIECRKLLKEYVDLMVVASTDFRTIETGKKRAKEIQDSLWAQTERMNHEDRSSETYSLFTGSINDILELHHKRLVVALQYRIPQIVMNVLYFISFFAMLMLGYQFGISGKSNIMINIILAVIFSTVMWLIFSLDDPTSGFITVNQSPLFQLQKELDAFPK